MKMEKKKFRIGHLADELGVERFVIRFWEKEFNVKPTRSDGGQRFYKLEDLEQFKQIKELLYSKGFTIAGAKKILSPTKNNTGTIQGSHKTTLSETGLSNKKLEQFHQELKVLRTALLKLKSYL